MKTKKIIISAQILFTLFILAGAHAVLAEGTGSIINPLCPSGSCVSSDPRVIIGTVIASALGVIGIVALLLFMWGGLKIMLSRGNSDEVKTGKNTMLWAVIGLVLIFSSYAIVSYIIENVSKNAPSTTSGTIPVTTPVPIPVVVPLCTTDTWTCSGWSACVCPGTHSQTCTKTIDCEGVDTPSPDTFGQCTPTGSCTDF